VSEAPAHDAVDGGPAEAAEFFDVLLADAALGTYRRFLPGRAALETVGGLARRPATVARRTGGLALELTRIAAGRSTTQPSPRDRRFADPAWSENPLLRRVVQAYLAAGETSQTLLADARLDWASAQKMEFVVDNAVEALAPSNSPVLNPVAVRTAVKTRGESYMRGGRNLLRDLAAPPRIPRMVDPTPFRVGENVAVTPGAVVERTELFELLQYRPTTNTVLTTPLLIVPPMINKFYAMDLVPGRSMVEYFVQQGVQVFMLAWRNPQPRHRNWGIDTYAQGIIDGLDAVERVTGADRAVVLGACSGGIVTSMTAAHLAATGAADRLAGMALVVTVLDQSRAGLAGATVNRRVAALATAVSARRGYLDGRTLAEVFAWLRPGDLIWNYWVNNYLLGEDPPAFDILFWNADVTRMPARLHRDFLDLGVDNSLTTPGAATVLGSPVDLGSVKTDAYVLAGVADHLCSWESCYQTCNLLGGPTRFVLSTSGHIAALVNPPGNPKANYRVADATPAKPAGFLAAAETRAGTWWTDFVDWLRERCGPEIAAPSELGGGGLEPIGDAPGTYVFDT
jgi:polyhydroxyalkanoate synthase